MLIHYSKQKGCSCINIARPFIPGGYVHFTNTINEALKDCPTSSTEERWNHIREAAYDSAMGSFGKMKGIDTTGSRQDWQNLSRQSKPKEQPF